MICADSFYDPTDDGDGDLLADATDEIARLELEIDALADRIVAASEALHDLADREPSVRATLLAIRTALLSEAP